jgi:hypothetical protein
MVAWAGCGLDAVAGATRLCRCDPTDRTGSLALVALAEESHSILATVMAGVARKATLNGPWTLNALALRTPRP